jgi:hypothetical protein
LQPSVASTVVFLQISARAPCPFITIILLQNFQQFALGKNFWTTPHVFTFDRNRHENSGYNPLLPQTSVGIPSWMGFWVTICCCLGPFWWESLRGWDFMPQLVVLGLFCGNPFVDGILGHNLLLSRTSFFTMEFWLSRSLSHELFSFFTMEFWLSRSLSHGLFSFFTMEFWLSWSLSRELFFSRWNSGYHGAFLENFFLFSRWDSGYHGAFPTNFFVFSRWDSGYHDLGEYSFHIYHKEYLHRIRLVKNLASWFRAPFARKRVRSFLF